MPAVHDELEHANTMISVVSAQGSTVTTVADLAAAGASRTSSMRRRTFCRAHSFLSAEGSVIGARRGLVVIARQSRAGSQPRLAYEAPDGTPTRVT